MKSIVRYFIDAPLAANLLIAVLLIFGFLSLQNLNSTFFPEVESRIINIRLIFPGASPEEVEEGVINKIEENLKGLSGIEQINSTAQENTGTITVEVLKGYDPEAVLEDVKNAVGRITSFPSGLETPVIYRSENLGLAFILAVTGDTDLRLLKHYAREIEEDLLRMEGISKVSVSGFPEEEIEIGLSEAKLRQHRLTFAQVAEAIRNNNLDLTGGSIKESEQELLIRAKNKSYYTPGFQDIIVSRDPNGGPVRLGEVATITDRWADNPARTYVNGRPAVVLTIQNTLQEDLIGITDKAKAYIKTFNERHAGIRAEMVRDGSVLLRQRIELLTENGILGFFLVLISLSLFLQWRIAGWVAASIPISFAGMFILANLAGLTINVISLFGMIIVIGILVDDGIVVSENIFRRFQRGESAHQAALNGTLEVLPPVLSAVLTTIVAFSVFFFVDGRLGDFFSDMAFVVVSTLLFSLVEALLTLPTHVAHSLKQQEQPYRILQFFDRLMFGFRDRIYAPVLRAVLQQKWLTIALFVGMLMLTIGLVGGGMVKTTFFPVVERDDIEIELKLQAGTREQITQRLLDRIEAAVHFANDTLSRAYFSNQKQAIQQIQKVIGPGSHEGKLLISLLDGENRDPLSTRTILQVIRDRVGPMPEAEVLTFGSRSVFGKPVSLSLVGSDRKSLEAAAADMKREMTALAELSDVVDNNLEGLQEIGLQLTPKAGYLGLQLGDILTQVRQGYFGAEVQRLQRGRDEVKVWVRYAPEDRNDFSKLKDMRIRLPNGQEYPLSDLATLSIKRGVININHINGQREIKVEADVSNDKVSVTDITTNIKTVIAPRVLAKYPGVEAVFEGQNRENAKSQASLKKILPIALLLMVVIIALTFGSISQTLMLMGTIPFGLIGVICGHWLVGIPLSFFSLLGIIALIGIMVNDGIVLVSTYNEFLKTGMRQPEALYEAGLQRFRPIFLTTATTVLGLAPLVLEKSLQAKFLIPMAVSVSYGLLASTLIILLLLPVVIQVGNRIKVAAVAVWDGQAPALEMVEPAVEGRHNRPLLYTVAAVLSLGLFAAVVAASLHITKIIFG